jgi:hypothetical protein
MFGLFFDPEDGRSTVPENTYQTTRRNVPDSTIHNRRRRNLRPGRESNLDSSARSPVFTLTELPRI